MESMMKMMSSKYTKAYKRPLYRCLLRWRADASRRDITGFITSGSLFPGQVNYYNVSRYMYIYIYVYIYIYIILYHMYLT